LCRHGNPDVIVAGSLDFVPSAVEVKFDFASADEMFVSHRRRRLSVRRFRRGLAPLAARRHTEDCGKDYQVAEH